MKKYLTLAFCLLSFNCLHAQIFTHSFTSGHIHVTVTDSAYHDTTTCSVYSNVNYTITIDSSFAGETINIIDTSTASLLAGSPYVNTSGTSPWTITASLSTSGANDAGVTAGGGYSYLYGWVTKVTAGPDTLKYVNYTDSIWVLPCLYGTVSGMVYIDNNMNCTYDSGDSILSSAILPDVLENLVGGGTIPYAVGGSGWGTSYYTHMLQQSWMTNYTISLPPAYAFIFPMSPCFSGTGYTFTTLPQINVDFPLLCSSNVDVQCYALSPGRVRRFTPFFMHPYVSNTGCDTMSGTMTLVLDSHVTYNASMSTIPADTVHGDTLIWNYAHLTSISAGAYWNSFTSDIYLTPDSSLVAGDTLCFRIYTNIPSSDVNPFNNDYTVCLPVVYSYDPNSKSVTPAGTGASGTLPPNTNTLTYTINFQNTGSDVAYDVKIIDTLDTHLDPHSLHILGASHSMTPRWLSAHVVEFDFNNIMLPDSTSNEPGSHGQVQFSIGLNAGVPVGTHISNTGYIYFDANPAVVTNTTTSTTSLPSAIAPVAANRKMRVYPNPASDQLFVEDLGTGDVSVLNMNGSVLILQHVVSNKTTIDISSLPPGVYMLKTLNDANTATMKFTKY